MMPVSFVGHGAPTLALDGVRGGDLRRWGQAMARPRAILVISAHWNAMPVTLGTHTTQPLMYDFGGFPEDLYRVQYPAPGAPDLAKRTEELLAVHGPVSRAPERGLDHGAWVPLLWMAGGADIPVLQVSLPGLEPDTLFSLGRALAPLRREAVWILASGNLVHNLRRVDWQEEAVTPTWATEFDLWVTEVLEAGDMDALRDYRQKAPATAIAHPTVEHFVPIILAAGAASEAATSVTFPVTGFELGSVSRRCVQFG